MENKEKQIILKYNNQEITINIKPNLEESLNEIKKKLDFQDKDLEKYALYYLDEEEDETIIEEDTFKEAFLSKIWGLRLIENLH